MYKFIFFTTLITASYANIPNLAPIGADDLETIESTINIDSQFDKISIDGNIQVEISSGGPVSLTSISPQNSADFLYTEVKDNTLYIAEKKPSASWSKFFNWRKSDDMKNTKLILTLPQLRSLRMHSMSYAIIKDPFELETIVLSGASKLHIEPNISTPQLSIKLRGFSRMTTANINTIGLEIMQSDMSTFNSADITTKLFSSRSHDQCLQHISNLSSEKIKTFLTGQGRTEVDKVSSDSLEVSLDGAAIYRAQQIRTKLLEAHMSGSSQLRVSQGSAKQSKLVSHNHSNYSFGSFTPGVVIEIDTTRDR
jgi:hypothetical protein